MGHTHIQRASSSSLSPLPASTPTFVLVHSSICRFASYGADKIFRGSKLGRGVCGLRADRQAMHRTDKAPHPEIRCREAWLGVSILKKDKEGGLRMSVSRGASDIFLGASLALRGGTDA